MPSKRHPGSPGLLRDCHYETISADGRRYIDRVLAGTQRMSNLIDDLLEVGRVTRVEKSGGGRSTYPPLYVT